ncbi:hypothetical protein CO082_04925 [Candidatus Peregrinibacteria bacterium CG_4_9_14_0_8_um_filter_44_15]|nr:MAG: hypothetical protein CO082_04925 [Candidatus Peregrinibacteria bacterium CG_4_9_14_0_8_um_filter_44_15]
MHNRLVAGSSPARPTNIDNSVIQWHDLHLFIYRVLMRQSPDSHNNYGHSRRDLLRLAIVCAVSLIPTMSCSEETRQSSAEYQAYDALREGVAYNPDFNQAHTEAYRVFIEGLEHDLARGYYTLSDFRTQIGRIDGVYYVKYRIFLNQAYTPATRHTVVDMRGTLLAGSTSEEAISSVVAANDEKFYTPNQDGKNWIDGMSTLVQNGGLAKHIWEEDANDALQDGDLYWYHAAKLIKGN